MMNKEVQQKVCTESEETQAETIQFAKAYEEGTIRQQSFDKMEKRNIKTKINEMNHINQGGKRWGSNDGVLDVKQSFASEHFIACKAIGYHA